MAAHALTICHQILEHIQRAPDWEYLEGALNPPGWDTAPADIYGAFYKAVKARDAEGVVLSLQLGISLLKPTHRHFHGMEDYLEAKWAFIQHPKPYWLKRSEKWDKGEAPMPAEDRAPFYAKEAA